MGTLSVAYSTLQQVFGLAPSYYVVLPDGGYDILTVGEVLVVRCCLAGSDTADVQNFENEHKASCTQVASSDDARVLGLLAQQVPLFQVRNADKLALTTSEPRVGQEAVYGTINYADRTTWFGDSVRVTDEVATDTGDGLTWALAHPYVIDLVHGKLFDEVAYRAEQPHEFAVVVKVNGVTQTMRAAFANTGGDYEVNYAAGQIVFFESQAGETVEVSYSYENGSTFYLVPDPGSAVDIEKAKVMWSADLVMNDAIVFEVHGYAAVFAPQLGLPEGTKIPIDTTEYETLGQLVAEAAEFIPNAVTVSGGADRGVTVARHFMQFRYSTIRRLDSAYGLELRIRLKDDAALSGAHATATFYCTVRPSEVS